MLKSVLKFYKVKLISAINLFWFRSKIDRFMIESMMNEKRNNTFWNLRRKYSKKRRKNIYHYFFTKKEGSTYKKRRKYIYFIISKKEGFLLFKKEKHTFLTFFFYQKRWKKEGKIAPLKKWRFGFFQELRIWKSENSGSYFSFFFPSFLIKKEG